MDNIVNSNFKQLYPKVENALKNASFIAIDAEFSGIKKSNVADLSLFDSMLERYEKLRDHINPFIAIQIGLTAFKYIRDENKYIAEPFNFYLLPRPLPFDDRQFSWQVGAIEFLTRHNFKFDKLNYEGISYLNEQEEFKLRESLKDDLISINHDTFDNIEDEEKFSQTINKVAKWLENSDASEKGLEIQCDNVIQQCCLQKQLRNYFKKIWTEPKENSILVIKVSAETKEILKEQDNNSLDKEIIDYYLGFTKVFKLLVTLKKPIMGHNILLDLMFIYKQFYKPLPKKYSDFKTEINRIFPSVYDTKFISYELKRVMNSDHWKSNILSELYTFFTRGCGQPLCISSPKIEFTNDIITEKFHDAGWDSYCSGFCFIKCAYIHAIEKRRSPTSVVFAELTNTEIFYGVKEYINCVNIIRADLSYIRLDGEDPSSTRPPWLSIKTKSSIPLDIGDLFEVLSSFRPVAIKPYSKQSVLVATSNFRNTKAIIKHLSRNNDYQVVVYNPMRNLLVRKSIIWSGLIVSGGLLTWFLRVSLTNSPS
ncbi:hypothetical protein PV328_008219 [Microctonus aethiopoides]|uniref:Uncharacterized protein n=1 Tax=Microctonus aethiopoides TaxID=144406 RepID=A0AA39CAI7_9HYME|nr:hypothetical protein PV328_008219 [Microctonus aethiopoides]